MKKAIVHSVVSALCYLLSAIISISLFPEHPISNTFVGYLLSVGTGCFMVISFVLICGSDVPNPDAEEEFKYVIRLFSYFFPLSLFALFAQTQFILVGFVLALGYLALMSRMLFGYLDEGSKNQFKKHVGIGALHTLILFVSTSAIS